MGSRVYSDGMGWLSRLRAKQEKTQEEKAAQRAGGRWENEGGALDPDEDAEPTQVETKEE